MTKNFLPQNWYWTINGDLSQVFSSASLGFVPVSDPTFVNWKSDGSLPTQIDSKASLGGALAVYKLRPSDPALLDGYQQGLVDAVDFVELRILFNHENRVRALEGKPAVTVAQFSNALKALL